MYVKLCSSRGRISARLELELAYEILLTSRYNCQQGVFGWIFCGAENKNQPDFVVCLFSWSRHAREATACLLSSTIVSNRYHAGNNGVYFTFLSHGKTLRTSHIIWLNPCNLHNYWDRLFLRHETPAFCTPDTLSFGGLKATFIKNK